MTNQPIACLDSVKRPSARRLRLAILGATGSIGSQTLDLVEQHPDLFEVIALTTNSRIRQAVEACRRVRPKALVVCDEEKGDEACRLIAESGMETEVLTGAGALADVAVRDDVDMVVTATVGYSGLIPTLRAIEAGKDIALANKETLVVAGDYIRKMLSRSVSRVFPVDSEHSAIAQCLMGEDLDHVDRLLITASGGPFLRVDRSVLSRVKARDALRHPNWDMGAKITIDSATMMNKAFEIVEAHYLFGMSPDRITAVVHPQSIVHSMVQFDDGAIKAQLGMPDMHLPIAYALGMNSRISGSSAPLTLERMSTLTFEAPDTEKFPCLNFAGIILERKGNTACVINAANEVAVAAFLADRIRFTDIYDVISRTLDTVPYIDQPCPDDFIRTNAESRRVAEEIVLSLSAHN